MIYQPPPLDAVQVFFYVLVFEGEFLGPHDGNTFFSAVGSPPAYRTVQQGHGLEPEVVCLGRQFQEEVIAGVQGVQGTGWVEDAFGPDGKYPGGGILSREVYRPLLVRHKIALSICADGPGLIADYGLRIAFGFFIQPPEPLGSVHQVIVTGDDPLRRESLEGMDQFFMGAVQGRGPDLKDLILQRCEFGWEVFQ